MDDFYISIVLCTYNGATFLQEQLSSLAHQTLRPNLLVACDDGSSDNTVAILNDFANSAPFPVHIYVNEINLGVAGNFSKSISLCQGDFIALCDQDDVWKPDKLEKLATALTGNPKSSFSFCDAELVDQDLLPLGRQLWDEKPNNVKKKERKAFTQGDQFRILLKKNMVTGTCMMFRSSMIQHIQPIPSPWIHDYWIVSVLTALGHRGIMVDEPLVLYRQHQDQQIGILKGSSLEKARSAASSWHSLLQRDITRTELLLNHLIDLKVEMDILGAVKAKEKFLKIRQELLSNPLPARIIPGIRMLTEGLYGRYSPYGYRTFFMDLICSRTKNQE